MKNLSKSFGRTRAINDVTIDAPDGKLLSILGPSGSGKTTLLRCIAGVETPETGMIKIGSKTVFDASRGINVPPEERGIGMVFQANALWPHMTVKKNVAYPLEVRGDADVDSKVSEVLTVMKMEGLANRYPSEISGGEQQRVAIARAIVYRPSLVLLDEPFSNLDVLLRESLRDELKQLQLNLGITMVYVTHDRVDALSLGDNLAIISDGRLLAYGLPGSLLKSPPNSSTAKFLGGFLVIDGVASAGEGSALLVRTPLGTFETTSSRLAGPVKLCIPPMSFRILKEAASKSIPGTVSGVVRFPSMSSGVRVNTAAGTVEINSGPEVEVGIGQKVFLDFDPRDAVILTS